MPQTRFVLRKAFAARAAADRRHQQDRPARRPARRGAQRGLRPVRRAGRRRRDSSTSRTSSPRGQAGLRHARPDGDAGRHPAAVRHDRSSTSPAPRSTPTARCRCWCTTLDCSEYVGRIAIGRIASGRITQGPAGRARSSATARSSPARSQQRPGLRQARPRRGRRGRRPATSSPWSAWTTSTSATRSPTPTSPRPCRAIDGRRADARHGLPHQRLAVRRPRGQVRHQPAAARAARSQELESQRRPAGRADRGHATRSRSPAAACCTCRILIETMRREGYELSVGKPRGHHQARSTASTHEPFEYLVVDVPHGADRAGDGAGRRPPRASWSKMDVKGAYAHLEFIDPRPRPDRPADAAAERHAGQGDHAPPLPRLPAAARRHPAPGQRRDGLHGPRPGRRLRPRQPAGARRRCSSRRATRSTRG